MPALLAGLLALSIAGCGGSSQTTPGVIAPNQGFDPTDLPYTATLATDAGGNFYIAKSELATIVKVDAGGTKSLFAGIAGVTGTVDDGGASAAQFTRPAYPVVDATGTVYVADTGVLQAGSTTDVVPRAAIRKITPSAKVSTLAGSPGAGAASDVGTQDGQGTLARFLTPAGLALDRAGNLYVADTAAATIRKITPAGLVTTFAGAAGQTGVADGPAATARFTAPTVLVSDAADNLYVTDDTVDNGTVSHRVRKITPSGDVVTHVANLPVTANAPGLAINPATGMLYVADANRIVQVSAAGRVSATSITYNESVQPHLAFIAPDLIYVNSSLQKVRIPQ